MTNVIGNRINHAMGLRGLTQTEIINKTGITKGALSSYISGRYEPKQTNLYKLATVLDVNPAWLMGFEVPMEKKLEYYDTELIKNGEKFSVLRQDVFKSIKDLLTEYYDLTEEQLNKVLEYIEFLKSKK